MVKVEIHKDAQCPLCKEKFLDQDNKMTRDVVQDKTLGIVHFACLMPYFNESELSVLFQLRCYSIGDTIAATPVIRELRRLHPKVKINVMTFFPDIFKYNPHVSGVYDMNHQILQSDVDKHNFKLDAFDEKKGSHFATHSVEYSAQCALNKSIHPSGWQYELNYSQQDREAAKKIAEENGIDIENDKVILIHPHKTEWETRDWGVIHFQRLTKMIIEKYPDHKIVSIGGKRSEVPIREMKNFVPSEGAIEMYGKMTLLQSLAFMDFPCMKLLVTPDTGTLHMGGSRPELPIVGIFTLIRPFFRTPVRNSIFGYKFIGVSAESPCNCTYTNQPLTTEMFFGKCPKRKFLETTKTMDVDQSLKRQGLRQLFPETDWEKGDLNARIQAEMKGYEKDLPCFPTAEKVMVAINRLMEGANVGTN